MYIHPIIKKHKRQLSRKNA